MLGLFFNTLKEREEASINLERSFFMTKIIQAVFENGVFRPIGPIDLPEKTTVELEVKVPTSEEKPTAAAMSEGLTKIYAILGERYASGHTDTAARHNEHQP